MLLLMHTVEYMMGRVLARIPTQPHTGKFHMFGGGDIMKNEHNYRTMLELKLPMLLLVSSLLVSGNGRATRLECSI